MLSTHPTRGFFTLPVDFPPPEYAPPSMDGETPRVACNNDHHHFGVSLV